MGALVQYLETVVLHGASDLELIRAVEDELAGGDLFEAEMSDGAAAIIEAREREADVYQRKRGREALKGASRGGIYLPHEIPEVAAGRAHDPLWPVRESIRFLCFTVALRELDARADSRAMGSGDYLSAVTELALRVSRARVRATTR